MRAPMGRPTFDVPCGEVFLMAVPRRGEAGLGPARRGPARPGTAGLARQGEGFTRQVNDCPGPPQ
jgi:hypothetical protein